MWVLGFCGGVAMPKCDECGKNVKRRKKWLNGDLYSGKFLEEMLCDGCYKERNKNIRK